MKNKPRELVVAAIFLAFGVLVPAVTTHWAGLSGTIFLPMHIPVLMCGFFLDWRWALSVGILTPLFSSGLTGMPPVAPMPMLQIMLFELPVYAVTVALISKSKWFQEKNWSVYPCLIAAMLAGRASAGIGAFLMLRAFGLNIPYGTPLHYVAGACAAGLPGIAAQLLLIPLLYRLVRRAVLREAIATRT